MKALPRQATLRRLILVALAAEAAPSVTSLATRLSAPRSSVSRALNAMERTRLVEKLDGWRLTPTGLQHAESLIADAPTVLARSTETAGRRLAYSLRLQELLPADATHTALQQFQRMSAGVAMSSGLGAYGAAESVRASSGFAGAGLARSLVAANLPRLSIGAASTLAALDLSPVRSQLADTLAALDLSPMRSQFADTLAALDLSPVRSQFADTLAALDLSPMRQDLGAVMNFGIAAAVDAQRVFADAARVSDAVHASFARAVAESVSPLSSVAGDLAAMQATVLDTSNMLKSQVAAAAASGAGVMAAHRDALGDLVRAIGYHEGSWDTRMLRVSATATAGYVAGARELVEERIGPPQYRASELVDTAKALARVDERLARVRAGAWNAVATGGPDWQRHAAHGGRELLRQLLERLAPSSEVSRKFGDASRKNKIRFVVSDVSDTESHWAETIGDSIGESLDFLSAEAKSDRNPRFGYVGAVGVLTSLDGLILVLVAIALNEPVEV